jgi:hypothetical protein
MLLNNFVYLDNTAGFTTVTEIKINKIGNIFIGSCILNMVRNNRQACLKFPLFGVGNPI